MGKFTAEKEAILKANSRSRRIIAPEEVGRALPADGTGWIWLATTPNCPISLSRRFFGR